MMRWSALLLCFVFPLGCGQEEDPVPPAGADDAADLLDIGQGGAADEAGFAVIEIGGSGRWVLDIARLPDGASPHVDNLEGVAHAFRLRLPTAASAVFIARRTEGDVDSHIVLSADGNKIATGRDQALLPMAVEEDAIVSLEAEAGVDYIFVVADQDLRGVGRVTVDVVLLAESLGVDVGRTDPEVEAYAEALRNNEPALEMELARGAILEGVDGYVTQGDLVDVPLRERADVNRLVSAVNGLRGSLYEAFGGDQHPAVGRAAAEIFWAVRAP